jgi:hypothetical protein
MAAGKREMLVAQAGLVWAGEKFDFEWYVQTGAVVTPDPKVLEPIHQQAEAITAELLKIPEKERSAWLIAKMLKPERHT